MPTARPTAAQLEYLIAAKEGLVFCWPWWPVEPTDRLLAIDGRWEDWSAHLNGRNHPSAKSGNRMLLSGWIRLTKTTTHSIGSRGRIYKLKAELTPAGLALVNRLREPSP